MDELDGAGVRAAPLDEVPRPIIARATDYPGGYTISPHWHPRAQHVYARSGVMTVTAKQGVFVVPPQRAVWMPGGMIHAVRAAGPLQMRSLYVAVEAAERLPAACVVVTVTPLLRELIDAASALPALYPLGGREERIMALILDEIRELPTAPLHLPEPRDPRLRRIAESLRANPADERSLAAWGSVVGASARTLARRFQAETGLSFGQWRQQARLFAALIRLAGGAAVTQVALDLGYESPSAFIAMFRRALGGTPGRYFA